MTTSRQASKEELDRIFKLQQDLMSGKESPYQDAPVLETLEEVEINTLKGELESKIKFIGTLKNRVTNVWAENSRLLECIEQQYGEMTDKDTEIRTLKSIIRAQAVLSNFYKRTKQSPGSQDEPVYENRSQRYIIKYAQSVVLKAEAVYENLLTLGSKP